jgi:flagellar P-ring protein FlgI
MTRLMVIGMCIVMLMPPSMARAATRLKDISFVRGLSEQQVVGYGLVFGLKGTGDSMKSSPFTDQSLVSMLENLGVNVRSLSQNPKNAAAVIVTANLQPFAGLGSHMDVSVSSIGDATSLVGGTLVMTPLLGGDREQYAVAQGPVAVSGFSVAGSAETLTQGVPTSGRISNGAVIVREPAVAANASKELVIELLESDFTTAVRAVDAINAYGARRYGKILAREENSRAIVILPPARGNVTRILAEIGELRIEPDVAAKVIIDARTGTIVIGENVKVSKVAVTHGALTVRITETPVVSQPDPFSDGQTTIAPATTIQSSQTGGQMAIVDGADLQVLIRGLNAMGLKPSGIIDILQGIKSAGALHAELVVQ